MWKLKNLKKLSFTSFTKKLKTNVLQVLSLPW